MNPAPKPLTDLEEKRILADFHLQQAREALERKKRQRRRLPNFQLLFNAVLFLAVAGAYAYTNGVLGLFTLFLGGLPLFFTVLSMFDELCRDIKELKEKAEPRDES